MNKWRMSNMKKMMMIKTKKDDEKEDKRQWGGKRKKRTKGKKERYKQHQKQQKKCMSLVILLIWNRYRQKQQKYKPFLPIGKYTLTVQMTNVSILGSCPGSWGKQLSVESSTSLTATLCFGFATLHRADSSTGTSLLFRQSSPSFVCLPRPTCYTTQTVLWQACVKNALQNPKNPPADYNCMLPMRTPLTYWIMSDVPITQLPDNRQFYRTNWQEFVDVAAEIVT